MTARAGATHEGRLSVPWARWRMHAGDLGKHGARRAEAALHRSSFTPIVSECVDELAVIAEHRGDRARFLDGLTPGRRATS